MSRVCMSNLSTLTQWRVAKYGDAVGSSTTQLPARYPTSIGPAVLYVWPNRSFQRTAFGSR